MPSTLVTEVRQLTAAGEPFVYAYYDGVDKVAHEYGFGDHFDAELAAADRLVADLLAAVPAGTAVVVTADHGQVHVGDDVTDLDPEVLAHVSSSPARAGSAGSTPGPAGRRRCWRRPRRRTATGPGCGRRDELVDEGGSGRGSSPRPSARLGDVALVARGTAAFSEPTDTGPYDLVGRHGSATPAELDVPLLAALA